MKVSFLSQLIGVLAVGLACVGAPAIAQEHPAGKSHEHPASSSHEHPEKKANKQAKAKITMPELATAIKQHIKSESKNGKFQVRDAKTSKMLALELVRVHDERLSQIDENSYFACVDMKSASGQTYDIDFMMKGTSKNNLKVTDTAVHKVDGKPRYAWKEEGGVWKKQKIAKPVQ